jgi:ABC-type transport system involved in cytochrome c biogenesis permease subunit
VASYDIDYFRFGYGLLEALILTKMVILGRFLRLGEGFRDRPRIVPTLYKTLCFSLLVMLFAVLESVTADLWHGKSVALALYDLAHGGLAELVAKFIMVVAAFTPLFALWEVGHVLGEGKLFELFFTHPRKADPSCAATPGSLA